LAERPILVAVFHDFNDSEVFGSIAVGDRVAVTDGVELSAEATITAITEEDGRWFFDLDPITGTFRDLEPPD
jgi:hypothetical protein